MGGQRGREVWEVFFLDSGSVPYFVETLVLADDSSICMCLYVL